MKKLRITSLFVSLFLMLSILVTPVAFQSFAAEGNTTSVTIHYNRPDGNYDKWNVWTWVGAFAGKGVEFNKDDDFGKVAEYTVDNPNSEKQVGFIIRKGEWEAREFNADRFIPITDGKGEVWINSNDGTVYLNATDAKNALVPKVMGGTIEGTNTAVIKVNIPFKLTGLGSDGIGINAGDTSLQITSVKNPNAKPVEQLGYEITGDKIHFILIPGKFDVPKLDANGASKVFIAGGINGWNGSGAAGWALSWNSDKKYYELIKDFKKDINFGDEFKFINVVDGATNWMNGNNLKVTDQSVTDTAEITTKEEFDLAKTYVLTKKDYKGEAVLSIGGAVFTSKEFNDKYYYSGNDLGYTYTKKSTSFKVWAPFASKMTLMVYNSGDIAAKDAGTAYPMVQDVKGTWKVTVKGNLNGRFYTYKVVNPGKAEMEAGDPYARAVGINGDRSAVVDFSKVDPKGWSSDQKPVLENMTDAVVYELHIRDLAMNQDSGIKNKGKYLEFTEDTKNSASDVTRGVNHLKELGINVLHLLPAFDYASVDEKTLDKNEFNWGYDPKNYNVPEGSYSTDPSKPEVRINEFKQMVAALHKNGIKVVMDVVYNHTNDNVNAKFNILVPGYYYRMNPDGTFMNGSGCGSETASERAMMRKYIIDSVKYWVSEYHVDGFRFDLMGLHDIETMNQVKSELSKLDKGIIVYGEGWDMGALSRDQKAIQPNSGKMVGVGFFNDNIRDNLKGPWNGKEIHGFVDGKQNYELEIMQGVAGSIEYNYIIKDYNTQPTQSINYVEAHDNNTLYDKLKIANPKASEAEIRKMDTLASAVVLTSQGVPFMSAGMDFMRTKQGDENSYKSPDNINSLDWALKAKNIDVFNYYKGLIELRKAHSAFRMPTASMIRSNLTFLEEPRNTVAYVLKNNANDDSWKNIFVAYNANVTQQKITVPEGTWNVVVKGLKAGVETLDTFKGTELTISPLSTVVMYTNDSIEVKNLFDGRRIAKSLLNSSKLMVNGEPVVLDSNFAQSGEVVYVPLASLAKAIGANVAVDSKTSEVTITKGSDTIKLSGDKLTLNGKEVAAGEGIKVDNKVMLVSAEIAEDLLNIKLFTDYKRYNADTTRADDRTPDIYVVY